jgi:hypothetical protein
MFSKENIKYQREQVKEQSKKVATRIHELASTLNSCVLDTGYVPIWLRDLEESIEMLKILNVKNNVLAEIEFGFDEKNDNRF